MGTRVERRTFLAMAGTAVVALTAGCAESGPAGNELSGLQLAVADQAGILQALLEASGVLRDAPYEVTWRELSADASVFDALTDEVADIGISAAAPALDALAADAQAQFIAASHSPSAGGLRILVPEDSTARSLRDLRDQPVCPTTWGSSAHYFLLKALDDAGIGRSDIRFHFRWPVLAERAFRLGDLAALVTWDPYAAKVEFAEQAQVLLSARDSDPGLMLLCARNGALEDTELRRAIADFRQRYIRAQEWARGPATGYSRQLAQLCEIDPLAAQRMASRARWTDVPLDDRLAGQLQTIADNLDRFDVLRRPLTARDYLQRQL